MLKGIQVFLLVSMGFVPLMLHWSISSYFGLILGSVFLFIIIIKELINRNITLMTKTLSIYFIFANILYFSFQIDQVITNRHLHTYALLGIMSLYSLLVKKPFTMDSAKDGYDKGFDSSPLFIEVNMIISGIWCATYVASTILRAIGSSSIFIIIPNILIGLAITCSIIIPSLLPET